MPRTVLQLISEELSKKIGLSVKEADSFVSAIFEVVNNGLKEDKITKVKGLGTFKLLAVKPRESINVNTGERVLIEGHNKVSFTPDSFMKELVNKPFSQFETVILNDGVEFEEDIQNEEKNKSSFNSSSDNNNFCNLEEQSSISGCQSVSGSTETISPLDETVQKNHTSKEGAVTARSEPVVNDVITKESTTVAIDQQQHACMTDFSSNISDLSEADSISYEKQSSSPVMYSDEIVETKPFCENDIGVTVDSESSKSQDKPDETTHDGMSDDSEEMISDDHDNQVEKRKFRPWLTVLLALLLVLLIFGIYFWGKSSPSKGQQPANKVKMEKRSIPIDHDNASKNLNSEAILEKDKAENPNEIDYKSLSSDPKIRYGAYDIVGVEKEVVLKKGETMFSYSKKTLGPDMVGYFQVLNGSESMIEGDTMKVPIVELRPEYRRKRKM